MIQIKELPNKGKGIIATRPIKTGELIFNWEEDGVVYEAEKASSLPGNLKDYAIQFGPTSWIDTYGFGRLLNHSCNPNAGIKGLFKLVSLRDIEAGEEIVWDYDTTENSDWIMPGECRCGSLRCRKIIQGYRFLSEDLKKEYYDITSDWIKNTLD